MLATRSRAKHLAPPMTMRAAVRRALDRSDGHRLSSDLLAEELVRELHAAGYRIVSSGRTVIPEFPDDAGRRMTAAEARTCGIQMGEG